MSFFTRWDGTGGASPDDGSPVDQNDIIGEADHVTPHYQSPVLLHRVPQKNKHPLLVTQAQRVSALEEQVKGYAKIIEGLQEQLSSLSVATPTSPIHVEAPSVTPTHPLAAPGLKQLFDAQSKPARKDLLNILRLAMNDAMGMGKDKDIITIELASAEEAEEYEIEKDSAPVQPTLDPRMRPFLPKPSSPWNQKLWRFLAASIAKRHEFDETTWKEMEKAYYERLKRLNSLLKSEKRASRVRGHA